MHHFFVDKKQIHDNEIIITGTDVNHIKNVLRMNEGNMLRISNKEDMDFLCRIKHYTADTIILDIISEDDEKNELPSYIYLFQGLPKGDKMELIIQKTVELGIYKIIPVNMKRTVVRLDEKKETSKLKRWNTIAESAAKQSKRVIIPEVTNVMTFAEALEYVKNFPIKILPYEDADGMTETKKTIESIEPGIDIAVFIGPEGGFDETEILEAQKYGLNIISLGKRILRTETAGIAIISVIMMQLEMR